MNRQRDDGRRQLEAFRAEMEFRSLLASIRDYFQRGPNLDRRLLMALTKEVQDLVDAVAANTSVSKSVEAAVKVQSGQITALDAKVAELQAKLDAGGTISAEDLAAIKAQTDTITETNVELAAAIPANTTP